MRWPMQPISRVTILCVVSAALAGCRLPVQGYSYHEIGATPSAGDSIDATDRDRFEEWTIDRLTNLRQLFDEGKDESDPQALAIITELEESAIDWKTFLVKTDDSFKFPMM